VETLLAGLRKVHEMLNVGKSGKDLGREGGFDGLIEKAKNPGGKHSRKRGRKISARSRSLSSRHARIFARRFSRVMPSCCSSLETLT
jgi:hypothetical protein